MALSVITLSNVSGGSSVTTDISALENEVGLLNFNRTVDNSAAIDNFVRGFSDSFVDETGVNTSSNSNMTYEGTGNTYAPPNQINTTTTQTGAASTNWSGLSSRYTFGQYTGNNGLYITGNYGGNIRSGMYYNVDQSATGDVIEFSMEDTTNTGIVCIYEASDQSHFGSTSRNSGNAGMFSTSSSHWENGNPQTANVRATGLRIKNGTIDTLNVGADNSGNVAYTTSDYFTINRASDGTISFKKNGTLNSTLTNLVSSTYGVIANDWRLGVWCQSEGLTLNLSYLKLISQTDSGNALAGTFLTNSQTAESTPSTIRLIVIGQENDTQTMNTDTVFSISRDGGTTFTNITMTDTADYNTSGVKIYTGTVDVSSQPSGTSIVMKQTTTASKKFTLHGYSLVYK